MRHIFLPLGLACLLGMTAAPLTANAAGPSQDSGSIDINQRVQDWKDYGGARLYWLSVAYPRQIRMGGLPYVDPASHPLLTPEQKAPARRTVRRSTARRQATSAVRTQKAPKDAGSTSLRKPSGNAGGTVSSGSVPIEQTSRRRTGGGIAVTTEVPRPVAPVSGGPWAPVPGTPPVSGLGMYDAQPIPAIIPPGSLPPGTATGPAMTPPVPTAPAVAQPAPVPQPAAAPAPVGGPADIYSPQTVPGTPLPPLPGSAAAQPMPNMPGAQGTAALTGTQNGMTARRGG